MSGLVAIIDYGSGNLRSAEKAVARAIADGGISARVVVTSDTEVVRGAERIVLPGVGAFADCMQGLSAIAGMVDVLNDAVRKRGVPFLGICVGMQLMASRGLEHGEHKGLDWIAGDVVRMTPADAALKIPHMGWNTLRAVSPHPVLTHLADTAEPHAYFVHSYCLAAAHRGDVLVETDYGGAFAAVVGRDNMIGTQFHPEKSQAVGLALLQNFVRWRP
ncbi:MAG: imidazole glycerol phosphate synthase subunit HisH [Alphaproteobacteria bacterium]|nr:imidazole glycerol phosphate synthase subunit HisH [Alphaproteobacteria bacterium]